MSEKTIANANGHRHEETDANVRGVTITGIVLAAGIVLALIVVYFTLRGFRGLTPMTTAPPYAETKEPSREPVLQKSPEADLKQFHAEEDAKLETYGWVDESKGLARIPIGRAIELMSQQGLPARGNEPVTTRPFTGAPSGGPKTGQPVPKPPVPNPPPPQGVQH